MGLAEARKKAQLKREGDYLLVGHYDLEVLGMKIIKNDNNQERWITEFKVLAYDGPHAVSETPGKERGEAVDPYGKYGQMEDIVKMLGAMQGIPRSDIAKLDTEITPEIVELAVADGDPAGFVGTKVSVEVKPAKEGKKFTPKIFKPYKGE